MLLDPKACQANRVPLMLLATSVVAAYTLSVGAHPRSNRCARTQCMTASLSTRAGMLSVGRLRARAVEQDPVLRRGLRGEDNTLRSVSLLKSQRLLLQYACQC